MSKPVWRDVEFEGWQMAAARAAAAELTRTQRDLLAEHANGDQWIVAGSPGAQTTTSLAQHRLIKLDRRKRPRYSRPTVWGRLVISAILARDADILLAKESDMTDAAAEARQAERADA